jgi:hypothetical protein
MSATATPETQRSRASYATLGRALLVGILLAPVLAGCRAAMPRATTQPTIPSDTNAELVEYISDLPYVTAEPAYRAVYILWKGEIYAGEFDSFIDRAAVGHLVARACDIRTGLNWQLFGLGRYAWRELIYRRIAHPSGEYSLISGGEFLGVLARAEEYLHKVGRAPGERAELGGQPSQ